MGKRERQGHFSRRGFIYIEEVQSIRLVEWSCDRIEVSSIDAFKCLSARESNRYTLRWVSQSARCAFAKQDIGAQRWTKTIENSINGRCTMCALPADRRSVKLKVMYACELRAKNILISTSRIPYWTKEIVRLIGSLSRSSTENKHVLDQPHPLSQTKERGRETWRCVSFGLSLVPHRCSHIRMIVLIHLVEIDQHVLGSVVPSLPRLIEYLTICRDHSCRTSHSYPDKDNCDLSVLPFASRSFFLLLAFQKRNRAVRVDQLVIKSFTLRLSLA